MQTGELVDTLDGVWKERLRGSPPLNASQLGTLETVATTLKRKCDDVNKYEGHDEGPSSPSDYSDSESMSTDRDEDGTDSVEEDGADSVEEESPPPCRRRSSGTLTPPQSRRRRRTGKEPQPESIS